MSVFTDWCEGYGYNPKGEFVVAMRCIDSSPLSQGDVVQIVEDDGTDQPVFLFRNSRYESRRIRINLFKLTQSITKKVLQENIFPDFTFKLSCGHKPEIRQWLEDNGCEWSNGKSLTSWKCQDSYLLINFKSATSHNIETHNDDFMSVPEVTPVLTPSRVVGFTTEAPKQDNSEEITAIRKELQDLTNRLKELEGDNQ